MQPKGVSYGSWDHRSVVCKKEGPKSKDETNIVIYRGNVCNRKGSPRIDWIIGRLQTRNQGPKSRDKKVSAFKAFSKTDERTL